MKQKELFVIMSIFAFGIIALLLEAVGLIQITHTLRSMMDGLALFASVRLFTLHYKENSSDGIGW